MVYFFITGIVGIENQKEFDFCNNFVLIRAILLTVFLTELGLFYILFGEKIDTAWLTGASVLNEFYGIAFQCFAHLHCAIRK